MADKNNFIQEIALFFPPFFFNHYIGPYLALPHLYAFLKSHGINGITLYDLNSEVFHELTSKISIKKMLNEIDQQLSTIDVKEVFVELLYQKFQLSYFLKNNESMWHDKDSYIHFATIINNRLNAKFEKWIGFYIKAVGEESKAEYIDSIIRERVAMLPDTILLAGISIVVAEQFYPALFLSKKIKEKYNDSVHITLGGCLFSFLTDEEFAEILATPYVDSIVKHEGEKSLLGLADYVKGKKKLHEIPNLIYFQDGLLRTNQIEQAVPLDQCPAPVFPDEYTKYYPKSIYLPVWVSRGCYWGKCIFCDYRYISSNNNKAEIINVEKLIKNIEEITKKHHIQNIQLITECLPPPLCRDFCDEIKKKNLKINWITYLRGDKGYNRSLCDVMSSSGCVEVCIGVESFNQRLLNLMRKGYNKEIVISMLKNLKGAGIIVNINIIINFPSVTYEEMKQTLKSLEDYHSYYDTVAVFPFLLSRFSELAKNPKDFSIIFQGDSAIYHCRGFHYLKFEQKGGATEAQIAELTKKYYIVSLKHKRRIILEKSIELLKNTTMQSLSVKPEPRFYFLPQSDQNYISKLLNLDIIPGEEKFVFDLDSKLIQPCPDILISIYEFLPNKWVPVSTIANAIQLEEGTDIEPVISDIIRIGVYQSLFALSDHS